MRTGTRTLGFWAMPGVTSCVAGLGLLWGTAAIGGETVAEIEQAPISQSYEQQADAGIDNTSYVSNDLADEAAPQACCESSCGDDGCECDSCTHGGLGCCDLGEPFSLSDSMLGDDLGIKIGGWTQWGYHSESNGLLNNHDSRFNNHQTWLYIEKTADGSEGWDWGFRLGTVYGVDAQDTQAFGEPAPQDHWDNPWDHGIYGWALPQVYVEVANGDWKVMGGHFYTLIGHEVVPATGNFFYSHSYTWFNSEPFTHTGVVATYTGVEKLKVYAGWTAGWDTGFDHFSDGDNSKGSNFLGGFDYALSDNVSFLYITTFGDFGVRGEGYSHSFMVTAKLDEKWEYILHSDLVSTNTRVFNDQISLVNYLQYTFNDCWAAGARIEWWKTDGNSQYDVTFGVNYRPHANLVLRPEIRHDWNPGDRNIVGKDNFTTFGIDAILTF